jgi:hypothetical protein
LAGTNPELDQSGKLQLQRVHVRRAWDKHFRAVVHQLVFTSVSRCAWDRQYNNQYRARGPGHHATLHALAHVLLRISYDEARFLDAV